MKIKLFDYHTQALDHGLGKQILVEETIQAAIDKGLSSICLTDHFPLPADFVDPTEEKDCTMPLSLYPIYQKKIQEAKKKFGRQIEILVGAEFDWLPDYWKWTKKQLDLYTFDYAIGSVHFSGTIVDKRGKRNFVIDYTEEEFLKGVKYYQGIKFLITRYYSAVQNMVESNLFDSIGHMDLVKKYNGGSLFSEEKTWYRKKVLETLELIEKFGLVIEINTSGFNRICKAQYPSLWILKEARKRNIKITMGSDAHAPKDIGKNLDRAIQIAKLAGYNSLVRFKKRKVIEVKI